MDEGEVSPGEFVEASKDPSIVFHMAKHDLDFVAFFIEDPVGFTLDRSCGMGRDDGLGLHCPDGLKDGVAVIGAIGEHGPGLDPVDQVECLGCIAGLASGQAETERVAKRVTGSMDLAGKAATRAAKSLVSLIFFAPAAQAWARTTVLSSISHSTSASLLNPSSKARQTPFSCQRAKRLQTLFQGPNSSGSKRQAQPARAIQSTVSTNRRVAAS
jgi:hypothetical protein